MNRSSLLFTLLFALVANAQHSISGTFTPAKDYKWVIAYHLKAGEQAYTADTSIKNGAFSLSLPAEAEPGTYRLVYAVPQEKYYFDVIYDGKEDVKLNFDAEKGYPSRPPKRTGFSKTTLGKSTPPNRHLSIITKRVRPIRMRSKS